MTTGHVSALDQTLGTVGCCSTVGRPRTLHLHRPAGATYTTNTFVLAHSGADNSSIAPPVV